MIWTSSASGRMDLAEAPRIADANALPDRETINDHIRFNRAFRKNMELRMAWESDRADFIRRGDRRERNALQDLGCDPRRQERHALRHDPSTAAAPETP